MTQPADRLQRGPSNAERRLVLLHGWGADADDLLELGPLLVGPEVSVVALRAPEPHPYGPGRQWYRLQPIDWGQLPAARQALQQRLEELGQSVPLPQTVLLGFS
ncbi:MAG: alpha/beta hydrolase, partial [Vulcanococcus sp.]